MADEITMGGSLAYDDGDGFVDLFEKAGILANSAGKKTIHHKQSIGFAAAEAIVLGEVTAPGLAIFQNVDETNFVKLLVATGGAIFAKLLPGEICGPIRLGSGAQVPFAQADTGAVLLRYMIVDS